MLSRSLHGIPTHCFFLNTAATWELTNWKAFLFSSSNAELEFPSIGKRKRLCVSKLVIYAHIWIEYAKTKCSQLVSLEDETENKKNRAARWDRESILSSGDRPQEAGSPIHLWITKILRYSLHVKILTKDCTPINTKNIWKNMLSSQTILSRATDLNETSESVSAFFSSFPSSLPATWPKQRWKRRNRKEGRKVNSMKIHHVIFSLAVLPSLQSCCCCSSSSEFPTQWFVYRLMEYNILPACLPACSAVKKTRKDGRGARVQLCTPTS